MTVTSTPSTFIKSPNLTAAAGLQRVLPELLALALHARQAHWNVVGPDFLVLHSLTDDLADDAWAWADRVAERAVALGYAVDARPQTVGVVGGHFPSGRVKDFEVTAELSVVLDGVVGAARVAVDDIESTDLVATDILVCVLEGLEKYRWMLRASST